MTKFLTAPELCLKLQISQRHLSRLIGDGLPTIRVGRLLRFDEPQVLSWLDSEARQKRGGRPRKPISGVTKGAKAE